MQDKHSYLSRSCNSVSERPHFSNKRSSCKRRPRRFERRRIEMEEGADDEELLDEEVVVGDQLVKHFAIGTPQRARSPSPAAQPKARAPPQQPTQPPALPLLPFPAPSLPTPPPGLVGDTRLDKLTEIVTSLAASVAGLATAKTSSGLGGAMVKILGPDKPILTGSNASTLHTELRAFKVYPNEAQEINKSRWFRAARAAASGRARATLESIIVQEIGGETKYPELLLTTPKADCWNAPWEKFEPKLKMVAGLGDSSEFDEAVHEYGRAVLQRNATICQLEDFAQAYSIAQTRMVENGLLADGDPKLAAREIEDLKNKLAGSSALAYLMELPEFPTSIDSNDATEAKKTILGRIRQYISAHRTSTPAVHRGAEGAFLRTAFDKVKKRDRDLLHKAAALPNLDDLQRFAAAGKGPEKGKPVQPGTGDCRRCR